ncbi:MAG: sulfite exporter TauE/SafE family protein [Actinomycetota bacterium]
MEFLAPLGVLFLVWAAFAVSASAGLGGSLLMVPTLALFLGSKEGVALAALLLATNNVLKIVAYRQTLPFRAAAVVIVLLMVGAALGSSLLVRAPEAWVTGAILVMFVASLAAERLDLSRVRTGFAPALAFFSGATSGFSGTSGPLKGVAIRNLDLDRRHFVGAASLASFAGDATKTAVFAEAQLLGRTSVLVALAAVPLMVAGTWTGSRFNQQAGERAFAVLFWTVMAGYSIRLMVFLVD